MEERIPRTLRSFFCPLLPSTCYAGYYAGYTTLAELVFQPYIMYNQGMFTK